MAWLLRDGDVLAAIEEPRSGWQRSLQGVVVLRPPLLVQTLASAVALDVAWCTPAALDTGAGALRVRRVSTLVPYRVSLPRIRPGRAVVASAGTFERWRLQVGDLLEVRGE